MQYSYIISHSEANWVANHQIPAIIMTPSTVWYTISYTQESSIKKNYKSNVEMKYKNTINFGS